MDRMRWLGACLAFSFGCAVPAVPQPVAPTTAAPRPAAPEYNAVRTHGVSIGPEADRLIVGFRATDANSTVRVIHSRRRPDGIRWTEAQTTALDVASLAARTHVDLAKSRQLTPSMHVLYLPQTLYGAAVDATLAALRADRAVKFADVDQRRYPHATPNDPLFLPSPSAGAAGQWYMLTPPSTLTSTSDAAATDAVSAWNLTTGSTGTVIADVDTGVLFDHPDLQRAGFGGRLLPGYDFIAEDQNRTTGAALGTYLIANDGDGWDPDPSDPGDWINSTDQMNALFPAADCAVADSSWHGTRVMGILGATTNNDVGIAGMTWAPYLLPVRALGKCGGYDSDIIAGIEWAAGMSVDGAPDNPYPADIINLSLGGSGSCTSDYADAITTMTTLGVLVVASAGNQSGPVDSPGNCAGVLAVAGLRNVGTKVGYSSLGPEVGVAAPAGNCVNSSGACLRSIDTTSDSGLTGPSTYTYTNETNYNLGTSFSAPIVSGIAALMRAVNANLTPAQLIARIESSTSPFPQPAGVPVCTADNGSAECACPQDGSECGTGMVNALAAVNSALRPIAAIAVPASTAAGSTAVFDAGGSAAACGRTVAAYAWAATGGVTIQSGANTAAVTVLPSGAAGTLTLTVTDSNGATDTASVAFDSSGATTAAPASAGTSATACPTAMTVTPNAPTVTESFAPASVAMNTVSTLTITLSNSNGFALTQSSFTLTLPADLTVYSATAANSAAPASTCTGAALALNASGSSVTLSGANIPAKGSCTITVPVASATAGTYTATVQANALTTAPAGANASAATADLTVSAPSKSGGGAVDGWDMLFVAGVLLAGRRHAKRRRPPGYT